MDNNKGFIPMIKTVELSRSKKTKGCAVTYRSGNQNKFNTCPTSCALNGSGCGTNKIDQDYLSAVLDSKPKRGHAMTYTHFNPHLWSHKLKPNKTTINYSSDSIFDAINWYKSFKKIQNDMTYLPIVTVVNENFWDNGKSKKIRDVQFVRCPAEYLEKTNCSNCGNFEPLCARLDRDYIIGFTAHGAQKKLAASDDKGGCYAGGGNVAIHWQDTCDQDQELSDADKLRAFSKTLHPAAVLRHHIAGDLGLEQ